MHTRLKLISGFWIDSDGITLFFSLPLLCVYVSVIWMIMNWLKFLMEWKRAHCIAAFCKAYISFIPYCIWSISQMIRCLIVASKTKLNACMNLCGNTLQWYGNGMTETSLSNTKNLSSISFDNVSTEHCTLNKNKVILCVYLSIYLSIGTLIRYVMPKVQNTISIFPLRG